MAGIEGEEHQFQQFHAPDERGQQGSWSPHEEDAPFPSHEELVTSIQHLLTREQTATKQRSQLFHPLFALREALYNAAYTPDFTDSARSQAKRAFYTELADAWNNLTYPHYTNEWLKSAVGASINAQIRTTVKDGQLITAIDPVVLRDPRQVALINAMADAVGLRHQPKQRIFPAFGS